MTSGEVSRIALADEEVPVELGNDWRAFLEACHEFDHEHLYILVVGPQLEEHKLSLSSLSRVDWSLVLDFDPDTDTSGLYQLVKKEMRWEPHLLTCEDTQPWAFNPLRATYWYAARGLTGRSATLPPDDSFIQWRRKYGPKLLARPIEALAKASDELVVTVVVLWNAQDYVQKVCELVDDVFVDRAEFVFTVSVPQTFSSITNKYVRHFSLWPEQIAIGLRSFFSAPQGSEEMLLPSAGNVSVDHGLVALMPSDVHRLEEELTLVHLGLGIEEEPDRKTGYAFLRGNKISWFELAMRRDVEREAITEPQGTTKSLKDLIRDNLDRRNTIRFNLYHYPGAGGTTAALRLAWDFHRVYPTVLLRRYSNQTVTHFRDLVRYTRKPILAIVESADVPPEQLDKLYSQIEGESLPVVFLVVSRRFARPANSPRVRYLENFLPNREARLFAYTYGDAAPNRRSQLGALATQPNQVRLRVPFFFGLTAFEEEFVQLDSYVRARLEEMTQIEEKILAYLGLAYWYAQKALPAQIFRNIIDVSIERTVSLERALKQQRLSLLVYEHGEGWRPAHALIAEAITQQILAAQALDQRAWAENLATWAMWLIESCAALNPLSSAGYSNMVLELLKRLFIVRDNEGMQLPVLGESEVGASSAKPRFARLIEDIPSPEGRLAVLKNLKEHFPEESHFWAHLGRLLSYQGSYEEALEAVDEAITIDSEDSVLHNMRGMILRQWVSFLMSTIESKKLEPIPDEQVLKINDLTSQAEDAFAKSRKLDPYDEHSYIAHIRLLVRVVKFGFKLSGKSHYAEFLASPQNLSYQNMVEKAESLLAETKRLYFGRQPSGYIERCEADISWFYGNYSAILQDWNNLLYRRDIYKPPIRRGIVDVYLARNGRSWDGLSHKDLERIVDLMQQNLEVEPDNGEHTRLLFEAMRRIPETNIVTARERLRYWYTRSDSIDAAYYLYVLTALEAIEGSASAAGPAKELIERCKQRSRALPGALQHAVRDWLGSGRGMTSLIPHKKLGSFMEAKNFYQEDRLLARARGRIIEAKRPESGKIELECGLQAFFVPEQKGPPPVSLSHHLNERVDFFLGFSYEGLRAWSPVLIP